MTDIRSIRIPQTQKARTTEVEQAKNDPGTLTRPTRWVRKNGSSSRFAGGIPFSQHIML
jgi:hypothetical protein